MKNFNRLFIIAFMLLLFIPINISSAPNLTPTETVINFFRFASVGNIEEMKPLSTGPVLHRLNRKDQNLELIKKIGGSIRFTLGELISPNGNEAVVSIGLKIDNIPALMEFAAIRRRMIQMMLPKSSPEQRMKYLAELQVLDSGFLVMLTKLKKVKNRWLIYEFE